MTMKSMIVATAAMATAAALAGCATSSQKNSAERADCPGKIVCPITGELVCIDQCPAGAGAKSDVALAVAQPKSCCAAANSPVPAPTATTPISDCMGRPAHCWPLQLRLVQPRPIKSTKITRG